MPTVPSGSKFIGISPSDDVSSKKSEEAAIVSGAYTIEDIAAKIVEIQSTTTTTTASSEPQALIFGFDNISSANTLVGDASDVSDWNTFFDLPTFGTPFTSVQIDGNNVKLFGATDIDVKPLLFTDFKFNEFFISINDQVGCIKEIGAESFGYCEGLISVNLPEVLVINGYEQEPLASVGGFGGCYVLNLLNCPKLQTLGKGVFVDCYELQSFNFPLLTEIGDECFINCTLANNFVFTSLESIGSTTGDDFVFDGIISQTILLTVPSALMTVNGGNPDGDIQYLQANNTVTITTV